MKVMSVFRFPNGMIATCGSDEQQIPELQGKDTPELRKKIDAVIDDDTELHGYVKSWWPTSFGAAAKSEGG